MKNDKTTVSANEINKFAYCPYQWYYEREYGRERLRELELERNARLGLEDRRMSNLNDGFNYHSAVNFVTGAGFAILKLCVAAAIVILIVVLIRMKLNV